MGTLEFGQLNAVGSSNNFYLYDANKAMVLAIALYDRFGQMHVNDNHLYVTTNSGIYCVDPGGVLLWRNTSLGLDEVTIDNFDDNFIYGRGQWDPPDGSRPFRISKRTGLEV